MSKYYAISYYGEHYTFGYIEMDFLDCETVDRYIGEGRSGFWRRVEIISAEVPNSTYRREIGIKEKTLRTGGVLFRVELEETEKSRTGFNCDIYSREELESRQSRVKILDVEKCSEEEAGRVINDLINKFSLSDYPEFDGSEGGIAARIRRKTGKGASSSKYIFTTYNVGQGLATSLRVEDSIPFLYFDYGTDKKQTKVPACLTLDVDVEETVIFLSHAHEDHWCGCRLNTDALRCTWVVPDQQSHAIYSKLISLIRGSVYRYKNDIDLGCVYIGHSASTLRPARQPKWEHEDGFAMYINAGAYDESAHLIDYRITVSGDQDYDYQDAAKYADTDTLVACHHGGEYCWSKRFTGVTPHNADSVVVYSYGISNTYGHPSKTADYSKWGWTNRHDTALNGKYVKEIFF